jgi:spermidine synthase
LPAFWDAGEARVTLSAPIEPASRRVDRAAFPGFGASMSWTLIESATEGDAVLELYGKEGTFMIRANGLELMSGFSHESETALGAVAAEFAQSGGARFLVGGLGLGYTVAALLEALGDRGAVTVAELSSAVISWFGQHVKASVVPRDPANLTIVNADVGDLLTEPARFDVIILDVDNGPEPLVTATNARLYSRDGLRRMRGSLSERGVALLWSGFRSAEFTARAEEVGFAVRCEAFRRARADLDHYIYVLTKPSRYE